MLLLVYEKLAPQSVTIAIFHTLDLDEVSLRFKKTYLPSLTIV
jgi:hypothetical protein